MKYLSAEGDTVTCKRSGNGGRKNCKKLQTKDNNNNNNIIYGDRRRPLRSRPPPDQRRRVGGDVTPQ